MKEKIKARVKGFIKAYNNLTGEILYDGKNSLTASANELITKSLGSTNFLSTIEASKDGDVLKNANVVLTTHPDENSVRLRAVFYEDDFDDTLDKLELKYNGLEVFSSKGGLSINKNSTTQIAVEWTLTITIV